MDWSFVCLIVAVVCELAACVYFYIDAGITMREMDALNGRVSALEERLSLMERWTLAPPAVTTYTAALPPQQTSTQRHAHRFRY